MLPAAIAAEIERHLRSGLPNEACGLIAAEERDGARRAVRFYPGANADASPRRYTMESVAVLDALRDIDRHGWMLGAIVHSHPSGPAIPSETDLAEAHYPDALMLIADLSGAASRYLSWRVGPGGSVDEAAVEFEGDPADPPG